MHQQVYIRVCTLKQWHVSSWEVVLLLLDWYISGIPVLVWLRDMSVFPAWCHLRWSVWILAQNVTSSLKFPRCPQTKFTALFMFPECFVYNPIKDHASLYHGYLCTSCFISQMISSLRSGTTHYPLHYLVLLLLFFKPVTSLHLHRCYLNPCYPSILSPGPLCQYLNGPPCFCSVPLMSHFLHSSEFLWNSKSDVPGTPIRSSPCLPIWQHSS